MVDDNLLHLAYFLRQRAAIDDQIAELIGRPAHAGHIGEFIAANIFEIELHQSAVNRASDGMFSSGELEGQSVNIKLYSRSDSILDVMSSAGLADHPDFYLVMTGKKGSGRSSKGEKASISVESIYLFRSSDLIPRLIERNVKMGVATSVRSSDWNEAMIYPEANNPLLTLTEHQRSLVRLFTLPTLQGL